MSDTRMTAENRRVLNDELCGVLIEKDEITNR